MRQKLSSLIPAFARTRSWLSASHSAGEFISLQSPSIRPADAMDVVRNPLVSGLSVPLLLQQLRRTQTTPSTLTRTHSDTTILHPWRPLSPILSLPLSLRLQLLSSLCHSVRSTRDIFVQPTRGRCGEVAIGKRTLIAHGVTSSPSRGHGRGAGVFGTWDGDQRRGIRDGRGSNADGPMRSAQKHTSIAISAPETHLTTAFRGRRHDKASLNHAT